MSIGKESFGSPFFSPGKGWQLALAGESGSGAGWENGLRARGDGVLAEMK